MSWKEVSLFRCAFYFLWKRVDISNTRIVTSTRQHWQCGFEYQHVYIKIMKKKHVF